MLYHYIKLPRTLHDLDKIYFLFYYFFYFLVGETLRAKCQEFEYEVIT